MSTTIQRTPVRHAGYQDNPNTARLETLGQPDGDDISMPEDTIGQTVEKKAGQLINLAAHTANFGYTTIVLGKADKAQHTAEESLELGQRNQKLIEDLQSKIEKQSNDSKLDKITKGAVSTSGDIKNSIVGLLKHSALGTFNGLCSIGGQVIAKSTTGTTLLSVLGPTIGGSIIPGIFSAALSCLEAILSDKDDIEQFKSAAAGFLHPMITNAITIGAEFYAPNAVAALGGPIPFTIAVGVSTWLAYKALSQ
jgi:hypothetical protein